jgi:2-iminobutanoate/2-iminopropanoate deaminase
MSKPIGPYTPIVRAGDWLVVSGQIGAVDGRLVSGGVVAELDQALANVQALLEGEGAGVGNIVKTTIFLRHMRDFPLVNEAYGRFFGDHRPARSTVAVVELPARALVEIEAWAYVDTTPTD